MGKILLGDAYVTRHGEKIRWKSMPPEKQRCIKRAVAYYNENRGRLRFIDWMISQPEIMHLFRCRGLRLSKAG